MQINLFIYLFFFFSTKKLIVRHIFEHYHHSYYSWNIREARKNLQYLYRKPGWGQDDQQLPHKASILQVLDWRVGNTTNKAHHHFCFVLFVFLAIYLFLMSMCSLSILHMDLLTPLILFEL